MYGTVFGRLHCELLYLFPSLLKTNRLQKKHENQVVKRFGWEFLSLTETTKVGSALRSIYLYIFVMTLSPFFKVVYISNPIKWRKVGSCCSGGGRKVT